MYLNTGHPVWGHITLGCLFFLFDEVAENADLEVVTE